MAVEIENQKYKECGGFNKSLDWVCDGGVCSWLVSIEWHDGSLPTTFEFQEHEWDDALAEYNRWGVL